MKKPCECFTEKLCHHNHLQLKATQEKLNNKKQNISYQEIIWVLQVLIVSNNQKNALTEIRTRVATVLQKVALRRKTFSLIETKFLLELRGWNPWPLDYQGKFQFPLRKDLLEFIRSLNYRGFNAISTKRTFKRIMFYKTTPKYKIKPIAIKINAIWPPLLESRLPPCPPHKKDLSKKSLSKTTIPTRTAVSIINLIS